MWNPVRNLPNYFPEPPLDPPEERHRYETIDDVPDWLKESWIDSHHDEIIDSFSDDILQYAEQQYEEDPNDYEEDW